MTEPDSIFGAELDRLKRLLAVGEEESRADSEKRQATTASLHSVTERAGGQIGPYKLLRVLGEGGMGIVYLAEQEHPIKRQVALKIIKPGMDTKQVIARFEAERQALALLDHPNIAHVHDAGTTEAGRPYFAMEYVKGVPIIEHCDRQKLTIEERLQLFLEVCEAIQHAHQKGVIHRDIKPSNILVLTEGEKATPKVIDFGIAKAVSQPLTERTLVTEQGRFVGTPEYMSPEQAELAAQDVDTRSDIYSLGVVLYQLLTGVLPFDPKTLREGGPDQTRRVICQEEPKTPSTRLTALGEEARTIAEGRRTDVASLARRLHRELEWIPLKAMRKDRTRRYRSASEFADDIRNYLDGHPLIAGPETVTYRVQKFVQRHARLVALVLFVTVAILLALGVSTTMYVRAQRAQANEARLRRQAQAQAYSAEMNLAHQAYAEGKVGRALALLEKYIPASRRQEDLRGFEWRYLWRLCQEGDALHTFRAHTDRVVALAFSAGGRLVTCSSEGAVKIFDIATKQEVASHQMQEAGALAAPVTGDRRRSPLPNEVAGWVAVSANGEVVAAVLPSGAVRLWRVSTKEEVGAVPDYGPVRKLALSPDGKALAILCTNDVRVWNCVEQRETVAFPCTGLSGGPVFSPDGRLLAGGGGGVRVPGGVHVSLWSVAEKRAVEPLIGSNAALIFALAFSPDGRTLATGSWDTTIKLSDVASRRPLATLLGHRSHVRAVAFSPDGRMLASASRDETVKLWDVSDRTNVILEATLRGHFRQVNSLAFSPDGSLLASGSEDGTVKLWRTRPARSPDLLEGHTDWVWSIAFSPDDQTLASGSLDGTIRLWDMKTGTGPPTAPAQPHDIFAVAFSPDGETLASGEGVWRGARAKDINTSPTVKLWKVAHPREVISLPAIKGWQLNTTVWGHHQLRTAAFSPDGMTLAAGGGDGWVTFWSLPGPKEVARVKAHEGVITGLQFSPDGRFFATVQGGGSTKLWITATRELRESFEDPDDRNFGWIAPLAFSPDSQLLALGSERVKIWRIASRQVVALLEGHRGSVLCTRFSPDGKTLATGSMDHSVKLWSLATLQEVATLEGHTGSVSGLAFSSDGTLLASSSEDKTIRLWRALSPAQAEQVQGAKTE